MLAPGTWWKVVFPFTLQLRDLGTHRDVLVGVVAMQDPESPQIWCCPFAKFEGSMTGGGAGGQEPIEA